MIKYDVLNRYTGEVQFTAEIDCDEYAAKPLKLGASVIWAVKNKADLMEADLMEANLEEANLEEANLEEANLVGARLVRANLVGANLVRANLVGARLVRANLVGANLVRADLMGARLEEANLVGARLVRANLVGARLVRADLEKANLVRASLVGANLEEANLVGAGLEGARLAGVAGNMREVMSLFLDTYPIAYTSEVMQIGCEQNSIEKWWAFADETIAEMDDGALEWWKKWKPILQNIIEANPATPTKGKGDE